MPYVVDDKGNHILDENGNKIAYSVSYPKHYTEIHENNDGHLDTENKKYYNQRIGRKSITIPKTNYTSIPLLSASDSDGFNSL